MSDPASLDSRIHAHRPDLAHRALSGLVQAEKYVDPVLRQCVRGVVPLLAAPQPEAPQVSQIRYGEFLDVLEFRKDGFAWVQNRTDRYVGYLPWAADVLSEQVSTLAERIGVLRTFVYAEPSLKATPLDELTLGSYVQSVARHDRFVELASGGFAYAGHVLPAEAVAERDYVFTAGRLLNVPYLQGGRSTRGIDGAGLVQLVLEMAGTECPRDPDQQRDAFGLTTLPARLTRGDIVYMQDSVSASHIGLMTSDTQIIHASPASMLVTSEPLATLIRLGVMVVGAGRP